MPRDLIQNRRKRRQQAPAVDFGASEAPRPKRVVGGQVPKWVTGGDKRFGMNDLFRLAADYWTLGQMFRLFDEDDDEQEVEVEGASASSGGVQGSSGIPGQGSYIGERDLEWVYNPDGSRKLEWVPKGAGPGPYNAQGAGQQTRDGGPPSMGGSAADTRGGGGGVMEDFPWPTEMKFGDPKNPNPLFGPGGQQDYRQKGYKPPRYVAGAVAQPTSYQGAPPEQVALAEKYGAQYGVDPGLLLAIAKHETGFGEKGLGRKGLTLGYGAYDAGPTMKRAGHENQYRAGAERLSEWGAKNIEDVMGGKAASWATDPNWESGVQGAYESINQQLSGEPIGTAHIGNTPLVRYGEKPVGAPMADALTGAERLLGRPVPITDGYRTAAQQAEGYARKPGLVAPPGQSFHESGLAVDVDWEALAPEEQETLVNYWKTEVPGGTWGGDFKTKNEPWHFSIGEGHSHAPPPGQAPPAPGTKPKPKEKQPAKPKKLTPEEELAALLMEEEEEDEGK